MTTSIAMTTYNGKKYVEELLDSIRNQTVQPDEVIIMDDRSTDGTYDIVNKYIAKHGLENWKNHKNEKNLGWRANFREAFKKCSGDLVFLCDQDDIWMPDKISCMKKVMEENDDIQLLISNYAVMDVDREEKVKIAGLNRDDGTVEKLPRRPVRFFWRGRLYRYSGFGGRHGGSYGGHRQPLRRSGRDQGADRIALRRRVQPRGTVVPNRRAGDRQRRPGLRRKPSAGIRPSRSRRHDGTPARDDELLRERLLRACVRRCPCRQPAASDPAALGGLRRGCEGRSRPRPHHARRAACAVGYHFRRRVPDEQKADLKREGEDGGVRRKLKNRGPFPRRIRLPVCV